MTDTTTAAQAHQLRVEATIEALHSGGYRLTLDSLLDVLDDVRPRKVRLKTATDLAALIADLINDIRVEVTVRGPTKLADLVSNNDGALIFAPALPLR